MSQLTNAAVRAIVQELVIDTATASPGLAAADYTVLINNAQAAYADLFPDSTALSGLVKTVTLAVHNASVSVDVSAASPAVRSITGAFLRNTGSLHARPILDILRQQVSSPTELAPTQYALISSAPGNQTTGFVYTLYVWPIADGSYSVDLYGTVHPIPVSGDSDKLIYQDTECRIIARMAAIEAARLLGRPGDFVQSIAGPLPDLVKSQVGVMARETAPRTAIGTPIA